MDKDQPTTPPDGETGAPAPSAASAAAWTGGERTLSDLPVAPRPTAGADWAGGERTLLGIPAAAPADAGAWTGGERTLAGLPAVPADAGAWTGGERTLAGLPVVPAAPDASAWAGAERTMPAIADGAGAAWTGGERTLTDLRDAVAPADETSPPPRAREPGTGRHGTGTGTGTGTGSASRGPRSGTRGTAIGTDRWHLEGREGPLTGQSFGEYDLGGIIGEGGMGTIYRARQESLGRRVAVKVLPSALANDPIIRSRFEAEARTASLIQSPHVVQVFAAGSHNDICYFVMEFVEGSELGALLRERTQAGKRIDPDEAADYVLQAARGLAVAAQHGVVHRDIKPANLLVTRAGQVKIADFGISKVAGEHALTRTGTAIGTPSYVSPEQGRGEPCDQRSDLYSLGVVFYELLTGKKPFEGTTANAIIYQHNYAEPRLPRELVPDIPEHYQAVVVKCLQKDPARRYQGAGDLVADLERIRAGNLSLTAMMVGAYGTGADEAMRRYLGRQRRWVGWLVAALLVAAIGTGGAIWWSLRSEARRSALGGRITELKTRLKDLDVAVSVPVGADTDLAELARIAPQDGDLAKWRGKLDQVGELQRNLGRLDGNDLPSAALRAQSEKDLADLIALVGARDDRVAGWRARLDSAAGAAARLAAEVDAQWKRDLTVALRDRLRPLVERLRRLDGERHPLVERFDRESGAIDTRAATLLTGLQVLDAADPVPEARCRQLRLDLAEYERVLGAVPPRRSAWEARLEREDEALRQLRDDFTVLAAAKVVAAPSQAEQGPALARYQARVDADDRLLLRVRDLFERSSQIIAGLRNDLAPLDQPATVRLTAVTGLAKRYGDYAGLVAGDDAQLLAWGEALRGLETRVAEAQAALERFRDQGRRMTLAELAAGEQALDALGTSLGEEDRQAFRRRLVADRGHVVDLRTRLRSAISGDARVTRQLADEIVEFGRLVGDADEDFARWRVQIVDFLRLVERLAPLDEPRVLPAQVDDLLAQYVAIAGENDEDGKRWRAKAARVRKLREELAPLAQCAPLPPQAAAKLAALVADIGEFAEAPEWRERIAAVERLRGRLAALATACLLPATADADLAALVALTGADDPEVRAWTARAAVLRGPGRPAWAVDYAVDQHGPRAVLALQGDGSPTIAFRYCPAGRFVMGSRPDEAGRDADENQVEVTLTAGFWIAETEFTQAAWSELMGTTPSARLDAGAPVDSVAWDEVQRALAALNARVAGLGARLPTEAEWEYACRAGSAAAFASWRGPVEPAYLDQVAWYAGNTRTSQPVGRRLPNLIGLFDLHGNVSEWCEDGYGLYPPVAVSDPVGLAAPRRVARGGSWGDRARSLRAANRFAVAADVRSAYLGFRPVITAILPGETR